MRVSFNELVIDCRDPRDLAVFWARLLGGEPVHRSPHWSYLDTPGIARLAFQKVPEPKIGKNRLHFDLSVEDIAAATITALQLGAERLGGVVTDENGSFQVLRDIEGNEFCFVHP